MKYMLLMQFSGESADFPPIDAWAAEDFQAHIRFMRDVDARLTESGELVDAQGLAMPDQARIVRAADDGQPPVVSDGPFPETKEWLFGYWIVDVEKPERAVEIAAYISAAPGPGGRPVNMPIQLRQVMAGPPEEL